MLTEDAAKWYIELDTTSYSDFSSLAQTFLTHFQLPTWYDLDSNLLSNFKQDDSTSISDNIHEWCHRNRFVGTKLPDEILCKWFILPLRPQISKDVSIFEPLLRSNIF